MSENKFKKKKKVIFSRAGHRNYAQKQHASTKNTNIRSIHNKYRLKRSTAATI